MVSLPKNAPDRCIYTQSQTPFEDPDTPMVDEGCTMLRPMTFEEMVYSRENARQPFFDMDSDLGA